MNFNVKHIEKYLSVYLLFGILFIYYGIMNLQGFDVTDFGYHLTNQYLIVNYPLDSVYFSPLALLSDIAGGLWLSLIGHPSLLWAKMGGALLYAICACIVYSILKNYFDKKMVFFVVLITTLFLTMSSSCYIHYFTFPAFLILIGLWLLNKLLLSDSHSKEYAIFGFLLGFMLIPIILSRVTLVLIFLIPIAFILYFVLKGETIKDYKRIFFIALLGFFSSLIVFTCVYMYLGIFGSSIANILSIFGESASGDITSFNKSHTMSGLIYSYIIDYIAIIIGTGIVVFGLLILSHIKERIGNSFANILLISVSLAGIVFILLSGYSVDFFSINILKVTIGLILLLVALFFWVDRGENRNVSLLLIAGAIIMVINPVGSNCGVLKSFYGFWLILPLSLLCVYKIKAAIKNSRISSIISMMPAILIALLVIAMFFQSVNVYRDDPNRLNLNEGFSHPSLAGIYSTNERVEVVDELLIAIESNSKKGDQLLMVNGIPMFYYLTETKPALGNPWLFLDPIEKIQLEQTTLESEQRYPELFVVPKVDTRNRYWPDGDLTTMSVEDQDKLSYLENTYIKKLNYTLLWKNDAFEIYKEPHSFDI